MLQGIKWSNLLRIYYKILLLASQDYNYEFPNIKLHNNIKLLIPKEEINTCAYITI